MSVGRTLYFGPAALTFDEVQEQLTRVVATALPHAGHDAVATGTMFGARTPMSTRAQPQCQYGLDATRHPQRADEGLPLQHRGRRCATRAMLLPTLLKDAPRPGRDCTTRAGGSCRQTLIHRGGGADCSESYSWRDPHAGRGRKKEPKPSGRAEDYVDWT